MLIVATQAQKSKKAKTVAAVAAQAVVPASASEFIGRDKGLTLFHALGKFLYNKRLPEQEAEVVSPASGGGQGHNNSVIDLCSDSEAGDSPTPSTAGRAPALANWCASHHGMWQRSLVTDCMRIGQSDEI